MKIFNTITTGGLVALLSSCGMADMMKKTEKIQEVIFDKCGCDDVRLLNYSEENFRTYANFEIVGADTLSRKSIANSINEALKKQIDDYCKIDELNMDFINKGRHKVITVRYCKIDD